MFLFSKRCLTFHNKIKNQPPANISNYSVSTAPAMICTYLLLSVRYYISQWKRTDAKLVKEIFLASVLHYAWNRWHEVFHTLEKFPFASKFGLVKAFRCYRGGLWSGHSFLPSAYSTWVVVKLGKIGNVKVSPFMERNCLLVWQDSKNIYKKSSCFKQLKVFLQLLLHF